MKIYNILAISGSLKASSSNTNILKTICGMHHPNVTVTIWTGLDRFPQFNPDHEEGNAAVKEFRTALSAADGVIISTPEYAFGVPGALKNALDFIVSTGELNEKPVVAISASPLYDGGSKSLASLRITLGALGTQTEQIMTLSIGNISKKLDAKGVVNDETTYQNLAAVVEALVVAIRNGPKKN